ncbi:hypothetical protein D3C71_1405770 [compost metagenome]
MLQVAHAGQQRHQLAGDGFLLNDGLQLLVDAVERELAVVHQQQARRALARYLAAQFAADATARTGDHHRLVADMAAEQFWVGEDRVTAQQVFEVQVLKIGDRHAPTGQIRKPRDGAYAHGQRAQAFDDLVAALARHAGQCQQHVSNAKAHDHLGHCGRCINLYAVDAPSHLGAVVIGKGLKHIVARAHQPCCCLGACRTSPVNQQAVRCLEWLSCQP